MCRCGEYFHCDQCPLGGLRFHLCRLCPHRKRTDGIEGIRLADPVQHSAISVVSTPSSHHPTHTSLFSISLRFHTMHVPQANVSLKRLEAFLKSNEQPEATFMPPAAKGPITRRWVDLSGCGDVGEVAVEVHGDFAWHTDAGVVLPGLRLNIAAGSLTAIVGPTGSGKSSILSSIVGLMQRVAGTETLVHGRLALVPQTPFIINATIRDNILFGSAFDEGRYAAAIRVASLIPDLEALPGGDQTELGEKGINISGGQKQRIALARAVYADADICLLDDPLSALDAHVGRNVFHECIKGEMKDKTVVLVTNQLQYVNAVDHIFYIHNGKITEEGTYASLMAKPNGSFAQMMAETLVEEESEGENSKRSEPQKAAAAQGAAVTSTTSAEIKESRLIQKERRSIGLVSLKVIRSYVAAMGGRAPFLFLMFQFILGEAIRVAGTIWLTVWTNAGDDAEHGEMFYMWIYGAILLGQVSVSLINQLYFKRLGRVASDVLHRNMMWQLIRAPMSFYHTTPVGRIINRVTKDTADIDKNLVDFISFFVRSSTLP